MRVLLSILLLPLMLGTACAPHPMDQHRSAMRAATPTEDFEFATPRQSARFENVSEQRLLDATARVLGEMGFTVENRVPAIGIVTAARPSTGTDLGPLIIQAAAVALAGPMPGRPVGTQSWINTRVTVTTRPEGANALSLRASFERLTISPSGDPSAQSLATAEFTTQFFTRLRSALAS